MMKKTVFLPIALTAVLQYSYAQNISKWEFKGHIKSLQNLYVPYPDTSYWFSDNTLDNRLQLTYYPSNWLKFDVQARNRFIYGDFVKMIPNYAEQIDTDNSFFDLSFLWSNGNSYILHTIIDRLNATVNYGNWQIVAGRQRINWGIDLVWNPNDIFNTFSYFDLEYPERPGTDALSVKYFSGITSFAEAVYQPAKTWDSTSLGIVYRFNIYEADVQFIAGKMRSLLTAGFGFTKSVGGAAIRSEVSYFKSYINKNTPEGIVGTLSSDYSFGDNWYVQAGILYNSFGKKNNQGNLNLFDTQVQSPMTLSRGKFNVMAGITGQFGPLVTPGLSAIANPTDGSIALIPTISVSATDNINVSLNAILLTGKSTDEYANFGQFVYLKGEWNF